MTSGGGGGTTRMKSARVLVVPIASLTRTVKAFVPTKLARPLIVPSACIVRPAGSVPMSNVQV